MKNKVIIIEDERPLGEVYKRILDEAGIEARWVDSVEDAEEIANSFRAGLILVDCGLSPDGKSGIEGIPYLKKGFPDAKLIIFSNYNSSDLKKITAYRKFKNNLKLANGFWSKLEICPDDLIKRVNELLG
ncbi:MAG: response regulator [Candidatus Gracilibacteria bacterium]|jgi:DNA-binding response OmpR family regulator|nr:response regulator [Candidatus Gracilibacteria bacterium]